MRHYLRPIHDESGIALITALLILMSLTAIGVFAINATMVNQDIAANLKASKQEFYLAEAGLQHAQWFLAKNITHWSTYAYATAQTLISCSRLSLKQDNTPQIADCGTTPLATDTVIGTYTVTIQNAGGVGGGSRRVLSTGATSSKGQAVLEALFSNNPAFPCVICCAGPQCDIALTGNSSTDSFDSTQGPYGGANVGNEGSVGANRNISLSGTNVVVHGNATAGGTVSGGGTVTGTIKNGADIQYFPPVAVCGPPYSSSTGMTLVNATYNQSTGDLTSSGAATVTLASGKYCLHSVQLTSQTTLSVDITNGPVLLYLTGLDLLTGAVSGSDLGGQAISNPSGVAENFQIYSSLSSATQGIKLVGGSEAYAAVYAPLAQVKLAGGSQFYGSLVGQSVTMNGTPNFHYDKALKNLPNAGLGLVAWRQVF